MADVSVLVESRGGNTRKVADAIAEELGTNAGDVGATPDGGTGILFLGSGTYGGNPGQAMMQFIESTDFTGRKVALFGTSSSVAGSQKMIDVMAGALAAKGAVVLGNFQCRGKFLFTNRSHPSPEDLENAKKFARDMLKAYAG